MRAWQVHTIGEPEQALQLAEVDDPRPGPNEVVIGVRAAALNFFDILLCRGDLRYGPGGWRGRQLADRPARDRNSPTPARRVRG